MSTVPPTTPLQAGALVLFFGLFFYQWGATNLEGLFNYPFWRDMGAKMERDDFVKLNRDHAWKLFPLHVLLFFLYTVVVIVLVAVAPPYLPRWLLVAAFALQIIVVVSSVLIQIPLRAQLNSNGPDAPKFDRLISTDIWLRKIPSFMQAVLVLIALWIVVIR